MQKQAIGNFEYCSQLLDRSLTIETGEEHILPDYMPTIARVISCRATASVPVRYATSDNIEYAGAICYRLLYEGGDDGEIFCASLPGEYSVCFESQREGIEIPDADSVEGLAQAYVENISVRVSAPRKLSIKSKVRLVAEINGIEECECLIRGDSASDGSLRVLEDRESGGRFLCAMSEVFAISEGVRNDELGLMSGDAIRVIETRGEMFVNQAQYVDGRAQVRGDALICMLYQKEGEGERPRRYTRRIPFEVSCQFSGKRHEKDRLVGLRAYGSIPTVKARPTDDGVEIEAEGIACAEAGVLTSISYPKDLYSLNSTTESSRRKIALRVPLALFGANATISGSETASTLGIESTSKVIDASVLSFPELVGTLDGGVLTVSGKAKVALLVDDGLSLGNADMELPFKYTSTIEADCEGCESVVSVVPAVPECKVRFDGETVSVDAELVLALRICKKCAIEYTSEANFTPLTECGGCGAVVRVCYPSSDDTLWSVAKRYKLDVAGIAISNGLDTTLVPDDPGTLDGVKFLII